MNRSDPQCRDRLAAEYVLGTLHGRARRRFERLLAAHPDLRQRVEGWERRLLPLAEELPPVAPPRQLWKRIEAATRPPREPWWQSLGFWRPLALAASLAVAVLGVALFGHHGFDPEYLFVVRGESGEQQWVIRASDEGRLAMVPLAPPTMPAGKVCRLWLVAPDGSVHLVGVLPEDERRQLRLPPGVQGEFARAQVLVTVEPAGERDTQPDGPVVSRGTWARI